MTHTTSPNNGDAERAGFEAWALQNGYDKTLIAIRDGDGYSEPFLNDYWTVWQAARRSPVSDAAGELRRWIDDQKGKDPLMDDMIAYIIDLHAQLARTSAPEAAPVGMVLVPLQVPNATRRVIQDINSDTGEGWKPDDEQGYWDDLLKSAAPTSASAQPQGESDE